MGGWRIWWIYNRLLYWFRFGFGKVIRVWWHSFNSSDSFPIGFSKNFKFPSDQSILSILYPMKILISERMLELRSYSRGKFQERGYEIIYNPLEMIFPLDSIDDVITWFWLYPSWLWPGFPFISSFINKPAYFTNKPSLKYKLLDF